MILCYQPSRPGPAGPDTDTVTLEAVGPEHGHGVPSQVTVTESLPLEAARKPAAQVMMSAGGQLAFGGHGFPGPGGTSRRACGPGRDLGSQERRTHGRDLTTPSTPS